MMKVFATGALFLALLQYARGNDIKTLAHEELETIGTHCFPPKHLSSSLKTCYETVDASLLTNKGLLKGMALAYATRDKPIDVGVKRAANLNKAGRSAFMVYRLHLDKRLASVLSKKGVDKSFKKLKVYSFLKNWPVKKKMLRNKGRLQRLASLLVDDPRSSKSFLASKQAEMTEIKRHGWFPNFKSDQICRHLQSNESTKWLFDVSAQSNDEKLERVLKDIRAACVNSKKASSFIVDLLDGHFEEPKEILKYVEKKTSDPIYSMAFKAAINPTKQSINFARLQKLTDLLAAVVRIKSKDGAEYETIKRQSVWRDKKSHDPVKLKVDLERVKIQGKTMADSEPFDLKDLQTTDEEEKQFKEFASQLNAEKTV